MATADPCQIEWGSAQTEDGTLTVELSRSVSKAWRKRFERVLALLDTPHNSWGAVHLTKSAIEVADVQEGHESELRHFLESMLLQANTEGASDATEPDGVPEEPHEAGPDEVMTATFRSFAAGHE